MYSSYIYKPSEQFVFSNNRSLNCHFHLQKSVSLLSLFSNSSSSGDVSSIWIFATTDLSRWGLSSIALLCLTKSTSFPFACDFVFPFMEVGSCLHSYQNVFNPLVSSFNQPALQGSTFAMLCLNNAANKMLVN